jgi:hypothetical protein
MTQLHARPQHIRDHEERLRRDDASLALLVLAEAKALETRIYSCLHEANACAQELNTGLRFEAVVRTGSSSSGGGGIGDKNNGPQLQHGSHHELSPSEESREISERVASMSVRVVDAKAGACNLTIYI